MNIEQLQKDKEVMESKFNQLVETDYLEFVNKYKELDIGLSIDFQQLECIGGNAVIRANTKITVEL